MRSCFKEPRIKSLKCSERGTGLMREANFTTWALYRTGTGQGLHFTGTGSVQNQSGTENKQQRGQSGQYSNKATGWTPWDSNPGKGKRMFSSPIRPNRLWGDHPNSYWYSGYFPEVKRPGREADQANTSIAVDTNERSTLLLLLPFTFRRRQASLLLPVIEPRSLYHGR